MRGRYTLEVNVPALVARSDAYAATTLASEPVLKALEGEHRDAVLRALSRSFYLGFAAGGESAHDVWSRTAAESDPRRVLRRVRDKRRGRR